ncbi:MAG: GNAT family N-acetyltransferase [Candidatus Binatus sp.]|uniref:GNAT family N-acetyltransferase n=1 Tax=Candidatus Binatus sp. TaxID=2811406 RepID=UPI003C7466E7
MAALVSGRVKDLYINRKYPIAGTYLTHYEDIAEGKKVINVASARLKQRGFKIWGETELSPGKGWELDGTLRKGGHFYGVYTATSPHDSGVGNFFLSVNNKGDMSGIWSGYDNESRSVEAGTYEFRRMLEIVIEPLSTSDEAAVLDLAARVLGDDYLPVTIAAVEANSREAILFDVAKIKTRGRSGIVAGFVLAKMIQRGEHSFLFKGFNVAIPADIDHANTNGKLGLLQTVGVEPLYQMRGIGSLLIKQAMTELHARGAETLLSTAWKAHDGIHAHSALTRAGFVPFETIEKFWLHESEKQGYSCPSCGNPCHCTAVLYKCSVLEK